MTNRPSPMREQTQNKQPECRCDCVNCVTGHCERCYYGTPHKACDCHLHTTQTCDICSGPSGPDVVEDRPVRSTLTVQEVAILTARCEALQTELADSRANHIDANQRNIACEARCEALTAERDQLLAAQQADQERFARDLSTFASGYTQALDDALKGKP